MNNIDILKSKDRVITALNNLQDVMSFYELPVLKLHQIDENTNFDALLKVKFSTNYDDEVKRLLHYISLLDVEEKRIIYCVHILNIRRKNLRSDKEPFDYSFGNPYKTYENALEGLVYMSREFIIYK